MTIEIHANKTIKEIQTEFSSVFPYLKLEFFSKPHSSGKGTKKEYMKNNTLSLREVSKKETIGSLSFTDDTIVNDLEKKFREGFGLNVQVFRKSGSLWLETTATDTWTLGYQNSQGQELDKANLTNDKKENDYHEQL